MERLLRGSIESARLVRLERVEDRLLWKDFSAKMGRIELKNDGEANVQQLWHGTGSRSPATILQHEAGLDPRFASDGFYGRGLYLAEQARYPHGDDHKRYTFCPRGEDRSERQLLLVQAAVGVAHDYHGEINPMTLLSAVGPMAATNRS